MNPIFGRRGAVVALHSLVAQASLDILRGGSLHRGGRYTACGVSAHERHWGGQLQFSRLL